MKHPLVILPRTDESLSTLLSQLTPEARDVVIFGPLPGSSLADLVPWVYHPEVMQQWEDDGTYLGQEEDRAPTIALKREGQQVRLRWWTAWTEEPTDAAGLGAAFARMDSLIGQHYHLFDANFASPVQLGRHLMAASWKRDGLRTPPAPPAIREMLTTIGPQGRHECLTLPEIETLPGLYGYDMRLAYLWCCKGLPFGAVTRREWRCDASDGHKVRLTWAAPEGWAQIGLLPQRQQRWHYPDQGSGWVDLREWHLAERNGWHLDPQECLHWEQEGALDRWAEGLQWCLRQTRGEPLAYRMFRRVALNTIGSLHRSSVQRHRALPAGGREAPPAGNPTLRLSADGSTYFWTDTAPLPARSLLYCHPEWTTTIWARCRARLAQAAMQFPRWKLVALRQDALFVLEQHPTWRDDGAIGRFRLQEQYAGPLPAPHSLEALDALRRGDDPDHQ